jgi:hypothetical protein
MTKRIEWMGGGWLEFKGEPKKIRSLARKPLPLDDLGVPTSLVLPHRPFEVDYVDRRPKREPNPMPDWAVVGNVITVTFGDGRIGRAYNAKVVEVNGLERTVTTEPLDRSQAPASHAEYVLFV